MKLGILSNSSQRYENLLIQELKSQKSSDDLHQNNLKQSQNHLLNLSRSNDLNCNTSNETGTYYNNEPPEHHENFHAKT